MCSSVRKKEKKYNSAYTPAAALWRRETTPLSFFVFFFLAKTLTPSQFFFRGLRCLIALINVAFGKGDDAWRLAWVESRLRYIEAAENLSYHVPGFRQSHNWFPKEIYFSATPQQVRAYNKKAHVKAGIPGKLTKPEDWTRDYQTEDNDGYEDQNQARPPAPTKMEEAAVEGEDNKSNISDRKSVV